MAKSMRYVAMLLLTWGTIAGAVGSALVLAALDSYVPRYGSELPFAVPLPGQAAQAGRPRAKPAAPAPGPAASGVSKAVR